MIQVDISQEKFKQQLGSSRPAGTCFSLEQSVSAVLTTGWFPQLSSERNLIHSRGVFFALIIVASSNTSNLTEHAFHVFNMHVRKKGFPRLWSAVAAVAASTKRRTPSRQQFLADATLFGVVVVDVQRHYRQEFLAAARLPTKNCS